MMDDSIWPHTEYQLLREAVQSFFQSLHQILPAGTFFVAENKGSNYVVLSSWNAGEKLVKEGEALSLPVKGRLGSYCFLGIPIVLRDGRLFGQICAIDRKHVFGREDAKLLERMADLIGRLIEVEENVIYDELTGVYRRRYLEAVFYNLPADSSKAVIFLDLDDFKNINDTHGHETGDLVLQQIGSILKEIAVVHDAMACRYAGDEFVILIPDAEEAVVMEAAEHLMDRLSKPIQAGKITLQISASAGICMEAESLQEYIQRADAAMYQIKRGSKHGFRIFAG